VKPRSAVSTGPKTEFMVVIAYKLPTIEFMLVTV